MSENINKIYIIRNINVDKMLDNYDFKKLPEITLFLNEQDLKKNFINNIKYVNANLIERSKKYSDIILKFNETNNKITIDYDKTQIQDKWNYEETLYIFIEYNIDNKTNTIDLGFRNIKTLEEDYITTLIENINYNIDASFGIKLIEKQSGIRVGESLSSLQKKYKNYVEQVGNGWKTKKNNYFEPNIFGTWTVTTKEIANFLDYNYLSYTNNKPVNVLSVTCVKKKQI